ncbi:hypothetical protein AAG906_018866 [Vitis piasezkii]
MKKVGKTISKFFLFNAIPFNAADNGPYYQSMIDTIAEVGPGIKGPTGYQIGNTYLEEEVQELKVYITTLKLNGLYTGRETFHEDDGAINCRVSRRTSNATQERDVDSHCKGKAPRTISSSSSSDDGDNGGSKRGGSSRGVGGTSEGTEGNGSTRGGYVSQVDLGIYKSWISTRIWEQRKHLERLTTYPNDDDYSSGNIQILEHEIVIHMDMINLLVAVALLIEVLDTINMVLVPNSLRNHIFLIIDHQANHLSQRIRVMNNSFNHILTTGIAIPICICRRIDDDDFEPPRHSTWN